jgi:hypothetical protein
MREDKDGANRTKATQHRLILAVESWRVTERKGLKRRGRRQVTRRSAHDDSSLDENAL